MPALHSDDSAATNVKRPKADLRDEHVDLGLAGVVAKISEDVPQLGATDAAGAIEVEHPEN